MAIKLRASAKNWLASQSSMMRRMPEVRRAAAFKMLNVVQAAFATLTPEDTGRLRRAWLEATGAAGAELRPLPVLRPSLKAGGIYRRIVGQWVKTRQARAALEKKFAFLYPPGAKVGRSGRQMEKDIMRLTAREARMKEEVDKFLPVRDGPVIMIGGRGLNPMATVRTTVYGGTGSMVESQSGVIIMQLHNKEPHASIVAANTGMMRKVTAYTRALGGKPMSAAYRKKLAAVHQASKK